MAARARAFGPARASDDGMVTAEAAIATMSLSVVTALLMCLFGVLAAQLHVNDIARAAARSAAIGGDLPSEGTARVSVTRDGDTVRVDVQQTVEFPIPGLSSVSVSAQTMVLDETSALMSEALW